MDAKALPWQDLQVFLAVAQRGSLSAAAPLLDMSAATVMRRLRCLEAALGSSLFARSSRGYGLTSAGRELLEHTQQIEAQVLAAQRRLGGTDQRLTGVVRVATLDDLVQTVLGPVLAGFGRRHPEVCLEVLVGEAHIDLAKRSADVAIRAGSRPPTGDVIAKRVGTIGVALYAAREYLRAHPLEGLQALRDHRVVRGDEGHARLAMEQLVDRLGLGALPSLRSNSMLARCMAVRQGLGVGLLPCFLADGDASLVRIGGVVPEAGAQLWILVHPDLRRNARIRAFVEHVYEHLSAQQARFAGEATRPAEAFEAG